MSMVKYRVHEVAKDFGVASKVIGQILTDYIAPPKNHMQVLETPELDVIFEYMTQHNQVASLEEVFRVTPPAKAEEKPAAPKAQQKPAAPAQNQGKSQPKPASQQAKPICIIKTKTEASRTKEELKRYVVCIRFSHRNQ